MIVEVATLEDAIRGGFRIDVESEGRD